MPSGGHGDIIFIGNKLEKPTNDTEVNFLNAVHGKASGNGPRPLHSKYKKLSGWLPEYYGSKTIDGVPYVILGNISSGVTNARLMDVKIGAATVSKKELVHSGKSAYQAWLKKRKLQIADYWLNSSDRGFRIIHFSGGPESRSDTARSDARQMLQQYLGTSDKRVAHAACHMLFKFHQDISAFKDMYFIAASLLFCIHDNGIKIKLIDFGHSYVGKSVSKTTGVNGEKYHRSFLEGVISLRNHC